MALKDIMNTVRRLVLCGSEQERKPLLKIESPTNVRRIDVSEGMPGLSEADKIYIREKASLDAHRLLSLTSHPPTAPPSIYHQSANPSVPASNPPSLPNSNPPSREPSHPLLPNAASTNLPSELPTPPRQTHTDASSPPSSATASRMKTMWGRTRRLSTSLGSLRRDSSGVYKELDDGASAHRFGDAAEDDVLLLELDVDCKKVCAGELMADGDDDDNDASPISVAGSSRKSDSGFEVQSVVGGTPEGSPEKRMPLGREMKNVKHTVVRQTVRNTQAADSSDSEVDVGPGAEFEKECMIRGKPQLRT